MKPRCNPFYLLVTLVGMAFTVTACAYGWRTYLGARPMDAQSATALASPLAQFLDRHGITVLLAEVGVLAVASLAAMAADRWWDRRQANRNRPD